MQTYMWNMKAQGKEGQEGFSFQIIYMNIKGLI